MPSFWIVPDTLVFRFEQTFLLEGLGRDRSYLLLSPASNLQLF